LALAGALRAGLALALLAGLETADRDCFQSSLSDVKSPPKPTTIKMSDHKFKNDGCNMRILDAKKINPIGSLHTDYN
jgi:hypothetical protein